MTNFVSDIFDVRYGHSLELNALKIVSPQDGIAFVSRKTGDNGISAFVVSIEGVSPAPAGEITRALGGAVLETYLQEIPFYVGRDVAILRPKKRMTKAQLLFYCACISANKYRYNYGRQANKTLAKLKIPSLSEIPSWVNSTDMQPFDGCDASGSTQSASTLECSTWKPFRYIDLFDIKKGRRLTKEQMTEGDTPFIGAIDSNNGYRQFVSAKANHSGNTITVNYNGNGVADAYYQTLPYWASDDVNVLYPKFDLTAPRALFLCTLIRQEKFRFNYGRKWHLGRMKEAIIRLPARPDGHPDWDFMESYVRALPYSVSL